MGTRTLTIVHVRPDPPTDRGNGAIVHLLSKANGDTSVYLDAIELTELAMHFHVYHLEQLEGCTFEGDDDINAADALDELLVSLRHAGEGLVYEPRRKRPDPDIAHECYLLIEAIAQSLAARQEPPDLQLFEKQFVFDVLSTKMQLGAAGADWLVQRINELNPKLRVRSVAERSERFAHISSRIIELTIVRGFWPWDAWPNKVWHVALVPDVSHPVRIIANH